MPGPGHYKEGAVKGKNNYHANPSSSFISETCRTHFDNYYFQTNLDFKAKIRQKIKFKDSQPGPGHYKQKATSFTQSGFSAYQFFGSTT